MAALSALLASSIPPESVTAQQKAYVTYTFSSSLSEPSPSVTLLESRNLIAAAGTTGLRTWEAALHLGNYLTSLAQSSSDSILGKSVLELGAGTGIISILCAKCLGAAHVIATDGSDDVVADLSTNFFLNGLEDAAPIEAKELKWGQVLLGGEQSEWNGGRNIGVVLGADVTYDRRGIPVLVSTLVDLFEMFASMTVIISATIRNEETFGIFLEACRVNDFVLEDIEFAIPPPERQRGPFYSDATPIRLCRITKSTVAG